MGYEPASQGVELKCEPSDRYERIEAYVKDKDSVTALETAKGVGVSVQAARRHLDFMVKVGVVKKFRKIDCEHWGQRPFVYAYIEGSNPPVIGVGVQ